jgi:hypothetical protein
MLLRLTRSALAVAADVSSIDRGVSPPYAQRLGSRCMALTRKRMKLGASTQQCSGTDAREKDRSMQSCTMRGRLEFRSESHR